MRLPDSGGVRGPSASYREVGTLIRLSIQQGVVAVSDVLAAIVQISALVFVVSSMLAMGLSLTIPAIIAPLKNLRLVLLALAINFIAVPFVAWAIQAVMDLDQDIYTGILLLATAAGAPFLPKLAQVAKGNTAFSVGLMVLLMVVTIIYMPIVLPLLLSGVEINPWDIAKSLIVLMLLPLGIGLFMKCAVGRGPPRNSRA